MSASREKPEVIPPISITTITGPDGEELIAIETNGKGIMTPVHLDRKEKPTPAEKEYAADQMRQMLMNEWTHDECYWFLWGGG